jgi:hypothetical protein
MEVRCWKPGCNTLLRENVLIFHLSEPPLQQDDIGYFLNCPKCGASSYPPQALCTPKEPTYTGGWLTALVGAK